MSQSAGCKRGNVIISTLCFLAMASVLFVVGAIAYNEWRDPKCYIVYQIREVKAGQVKMEAIPFDGQAVKHKKSVKTFPLNFFSLSNQPRLKVGSYCYFFTEGSNDTLTAEITRDKTLAAAYAKGPSASKVEDWGTYEFSAWFADPIAYNRANGRE